jgi:hypothetical protein
MLDAPPIAVFGDWHGDSGWALTAVRSAAREGARIAIHVGDFGLDWPGAKRGRYETKLNKYLADLGLTLVVSGGNHDNWDTLGKLPSRTTGWPLSVRTSASCLEAAAPCLRGWPSAV